MNLGKYNRSATMSEGECTEVIIAYVRPISEQDRELDEEIPADVTHIACDENGEAFAGFSGIDFAFLTLKEEGIIPYYLQ